MKYFLILCFSSFLFCCSSYLSNDSPIELPIYYDTDWNPVPEIKSSNMSDQNSSVKLRIIRFGFLPCSCEDEFTCGCCTNMRLRSGNRLMCTNVTYYPYEFSLGMKMLVDGESLYQRVVSAKNPPPICYDVVQIPTLQFCLKFFDIYTPGRNLHMCVNFETRIIRAPILVLEFDCFQMGSEGFLHGKPDDFNKNETLIESDEYLTTTENSVDSTETTTMFDVDNPTTVLTDEFSFDATEDPNGEDSTDILSNTELSDKTFLYTTEFYSADLDKNNFTTDTTEIVNNNIENK